jgi:hypothetical protein
LLEAAQAQATEEVGAGGRSTHEKKYDDNDGRMLLSGITTTTTRQKYFQKNRNG